MIPFVFPRRVSLKLKMFGGTMIGLDESRRLAEDRGAAAVAALAPYESPVADALRDLARYIVVRAQ